MQRFYNINCANNNINNVLRAFEAHVEYYARVLGTLKYAPHRSIGAHSLIEQDLYNVLCML